MGWDCEIGMSCKLTAYNYAGIRSLSMSWWMKQSLPGIDKVGAGPATRNAVATQKKEKSN